MAMTGFLFLEAITIGKWFYSSMRGPVIKLTRRQGGNSFAAVVLQISQLFNRLDQRHCLASRYGQRRLHSGHDHSRPFGSQSSVLRFPAVARNPFVFCHRCVGVVRQHLLGSFAAKNRIHSACDSCYWVFWDFDSLGLSCPSWLST